MEIQSNWLIYKSIASKNDPYLLDKSIILFISKEPIQSKHSIVRVLSPVGVGLLGKDRVNDDNYKYKGTEKMGEVNAWTVLVNSPH